MVVRYVFKNAYGYTIVWSGAAYLLTVVIVVVAVPLAVQDAQGVTTIDGTEVAWNVVDSKGHEYRWTMPVTTYENNIVESRYHVRDRVNLDLDGETRRVIGLDGFVRESFGNVIDGVYDNSHSNSDFIWEVWYIVSQLTVYDEDIHEYSEGRYALETLTRGGGDCEDLVILVADMLMSSKHTDGWTFQYAYMDSDNPRDPQKINHVILYVHDGEYGHLIEATAPPSWSIFPDGVVGWYLDVVLYTEDLDFTGQDLRWMDLTNRDFTGAVFVNARMSGADLSGADLFSAHLTGADLSSAHLYETNLALADLTGAHLTGADLSYADLSLTDLTGADLSYADLSYADLSDADLVSADLSGADLAFADLSGANLVSADLSGADLAFADLSGADLSYTDLSYTDLSYTDLAYTYLTGANIVSSNLAGAILINADLSSASLAGANLTYAVLVWTNLSGTDLSGADLSETVLYAVYGQ